MPPPLYHADGAGSCSQGPVPGERNPDVDLLDMPGGVRRRAVRVDLVRRSCAGGSCCRWRSLGNHVSLLCHSRHRGRPQHTMRKNKAISYPLLGYAARDRSTGIPGDATPNCRERLLRERDILRCCGHTACTERHAKAVHAIPDAFQCASRRARRYARMGRAVRRPRGRLRTCGYISMMKHPWHWI